MTNSILGADPTSFVQTEEATLEAVSLCELGTVEFRRTELLCVKCAEDAFMNEGSLCLSASSVHQRGCPALELAPECS